MVLPKEMDAPQTAGSLKVIVFVNKEPRKIPGQLQLPIENAAKMETPAGTQIGAGHI